MLAVQCLLSDCNHAVCYVVLKGESTIYQVKIKAIVASFCLRTQQATPEATHHEDIITMC